MGRDYRVSAAAVARAITRNTVLVVASSPCFPHGVIDDVASIAKVGHAHALAFSGTVMSCAAVNARPGRQPGKMFAKCAERFASSIVLL